MNNQQAINLLKGLEKNLDDYCELNDEGKTAFGMAITALELFGNSEQLPSIQPDITTHDSNVVKKGGNDEDRTTDDLISRQAVIDIFTELYGISAIGSVFDKYEWADICETTANELPSVQPTLYGYNIGHLELIARVLQKEDLPPERVVEALTDIGRIVAIVRDALKEKVFHNLSDEFYGAMQVLDELPSIQPEQRWIPVTEIPPYGKDLMLKLHDRRRGCDCFYYFAMGFYDGREYHTYLFKYQDDHDLEVVGWQLCPWKGEQE